MLDHFRSETDLVDIHSTSFSINLTTISYMYIADNVGCLVEMLGRGGAVGCTDN